MLYFKRKEHFYMVNIYHLVHCVFNVLLHLCTAYNGERTAVQTTLLFR